MRSAQFARSVAAWFAIAAFASMAHAQIVKPATSPHPAYAGRLADNAWVR